jgi:predicted thioesterase
MIEPGFTYEKEKVVAEAETAEKISSGALPVFSTPSMIAFMEDTAFDAVEDQLDEGQTTVGMVVDIEHIKPTPPGERVTCSAELVKIEGPKLHFKVVAKDETGTIGRGKHVRCIIDKKDFMAQLEK